MNPRISYRSIITTLVISFLVSSCVTSPSEKPSTIPSEAPQLPTATALPSPTATLQIPVSRGTPVPSKVEAITAENSSQIIELARWGQTPRWDSGSSFAGMAAYSPDGKAIIVGANNGIFVFDSETLEELNFTPLDIVFSSMGYSPDGKLMAITNYDSNYEAKIIILDSSNYSVVHTFKGRCFAFSPTSEFLAVCDDDVTIYNLSNEELVSKFVSKNSLDVSAIVFAPDGNSLYSFDGQTLFQTQVSDGSLLLSFSTGAFDAAILYQGYAIQFSPNRTSFAVSLHGSVQLYDLTTKSTYATLKNEFFGPMKFSPDGQSLAISTGFGSIGIWNALTGEKVKTINAETLEEMKKQGIVPGGLLRPISGQVDFSPDGKILLQVENDYVRLWNIEDWSLKKENRVTSIPKLGLSLSPKGDFLASVNAGGTVELLQYPSGDVVNNQLVSNAQNLEFLEDGQMVGIINGHFVRISLDKIDAPETVVENVGSSQWIAVSEDNTLVAFENYKLGGNGVSVFNIVDGRELFATNPGGGRSTSDLEFSPDGKYFAISAVKYSGFFYGITQPTLEGSQTKVYDVSSGEFLSLFMPGTTEIIDGVHLAFSPDSKYLATETNDYLFLWDLATLKQVYSVEKPAFISSLIFSPDGALLVSGDANGKISIMNGMDGSLIAELNGHKSAIADLLFTKDGINLISSSDDGTIRIWGLKS